MSTSQENRSRAGARGHAVVIEDIAADRALLEGLLLSHGYAPSLHDRPDVEPAQLVGAQPRVILLSADVKNGFNLCLRFKKDPVLRRVPLVLMTAKASPEVIRKHRMLPTRADAYLTKPLTEAAVLATLTELLPEDFGPNGRDFEEAIADIPERTLVSNGTLESAVVNYVEEEVRTLKTVVERLMSEKSNLGGKVVDLESQMRSHREMLDSGLERMAPRREGEGTSTPEPEAEDLEKLLESTRKEAYDAGMEAGRQDRRIKGLEQGRREGRAEAAAEFQGEREELEAHVAKLTATVAALTANNAAVAGRIQEMESRAAELAGRESGYRAELAQTTELFERLEGGYKDALSKAEAERANADEALGRVEAERDELAERLAAGDEAAQALAERDERIAALEAEITTMQRRLEAFTAVGARVGELEKDVTDLTGELEAAREALADLEPLRQAAAAGRAEVERLQARLQRAREALEAVEDPS